MFDVQIIPNKTFINKVILIFLTLQVYRENLVKEVIKLINN